MKVLGIESSCDETAASVVVDGREVISNVVHSQIDLHKVYGGVVPEIAARSHIEMINPVIDQALSDAKATWDDIDAIAVTYTPGLIGSLLVGGLAAKTLALIKNKPLYPIHHIEAHVYANFLGDFKPVFPFLALIVSGGHTQLMMFYDHGKYEILGQTQDDAVGEAFDKVAKILGLDYPGGPSIAREALKGQSDKYKLPIAKLDGRYDFSFSGLKTAVLRAVQKQVGVSHDFPSKMLPSKLKTSQKQDFAASFQHVAIETLIQKTKLAYDEYKPGYVLLAGGVAANKNLRDRMIEEFGSKAHFANLKYCTDNAAMVAGLGYYHATHHSPTNPMDLEIKPVTSIMEAIWR